MRALVKKLLCSLALLAFVRGSGANFDADVLEAEVELEKRAAANTTTLKAPIIGVPSETWYVLLFSIKNAGAVV
jgi:hypothetical protein